MGGADAAAVLADLSVFGIAFAEEEDEAELSGKLVEFCTLYRLTEGKLADEVVAFTAKKKVTLLTAEFLDLFEHEVLNKRTPKPQKRKEARSSGTKDVNSLQELLDVQEEEENLLDTYTSPSRGSQKRPITTPENPRSKRVLSGHSPRLVFSPHSFSPGATPSQKYGSRSNRGEVVTSFGPVEGITWAGNGGSKTSVSLFRPPKDPLVGPYKFMFQDLFNIRDVLFCKMEELGREIKEHHQIEEFSSAVVPAQEPVTVLGQIGCDSNGKLNAKSVILEGDLEHSSGGLIPVDLSELQEYSLFPGQVVVMEGLNSTGERLIASKLYEGVPLPFHQPTDLTEDSERCVALVACGPYTTSDSITYDPMLDLIDVINRDKPDVCILLGPFLDVKHKLIEESQLTAPFEDVFKRCLKMIVEGTRCAGSHLVVVPSLRDVHHDWIYPQPPFACCELPKEDKQRVLFVSDPCTLEINGVVFGLTSADVLFHMGTDEISSSSSVLDRFSRILKHILTQRSYYPLYPPAEELNVDYENFFHHALLPVTPDVLITPSEMRYFVKDILGCVCVNPGRLTKGQVGGTYGRLSIQREACAEERRSLSILAQVVRI